MAFIGVNVLSVVNGAESTPSTPLAVEPPTGPSPQSLQRADSILHSLDFKSLKGVPDTVLIGAAVAQRDSAHPEHLAAVRIELEARKAARESAVRVEVVVRLASVASTVEGARCQSASKARAARLIAAHGEWSNGDLSTIMCGWIQRGMTADQVRASWGAPSDVNRSVGSWGVHEQWVFGSSSATYVYLENGIVTSWQSSR